MYVCGVWGASSVKTANDSAGEGKVSDYMRLGFKKLHFKVHILKRTYNQDKYIKIMTGFVRTVTAIIS